MEKSPVNPLFKTKQVKIDTLGEYLQQVRKQLNLDIKTVSILAQIKPSYIELLEAGAYPQLPADVYIRGFLKSLADFYHIKEQVLIDQYEKERGFELTPPATKKFIKENWLSLTPRTLILGSSLLVALIAIIYIGIEIRSVLIPPYLSVNEPSSDMTVDGNSVVISGTSEIGAEVYINNQPILVDQNGSFTETLLLSSGLNVVEVSAKNKFDKVSKVERKITSNAVVAKPAEQENVNITIQIGPNSAWLNLQADGVLVHRGTMLPGSEKTITAKNEIIVTTANAGSTKLIYNGKDLGILGREGEVIRNVEFASTSQ
jgi:cytoskeletal protein RodZ